MTPPMVKRDSARLPPSRTEGTHFYGAGIQPAADPDFRGPKVSGPGGSPLFSDSASEAARIEHGITSSKQGCLPSPAQRGYNAIVGWKEPKRQDVIHQNIDGLHRLAGLATNA